MAIERSKMVQTDSKGNVTRAAKDTSSDTDTCKFWWNSPLETMAQDIAGTILFIQNHEAGRLEQLLTSTRLYGTSHMMGAYGRPMTRSQSAQSPINQRISFNLIASVIDTLQAKIAKNKVIPTFVTNGGVWGMQKKAEQLSKFIEGCFYGVDMHRKGTQCFRDGGVWGSGLVYIYRDEDEIGVERAFPHELFVDHIEAVSTGRPTQLHRVKICDRDALKYCFRDDKDCVEAIEKAMPASYEEIGAQASAADLVKVMESWHLPSGEDAGDGVHVICIDDYVLLKEEWKKDYFPFVKFDYSKELVGYWGKGAAERLQSIQWEVNSLMMLDQRSRWMMSSFKILVENGSKVVSQHLNNDIGTIIHYSGTPPQYVLPPAIDPSNGEKVNDLISKAYQQEGVSQLSASSMKPMGLDSGKALRAYNDIEEDRQLFIQQEMETFYLECARQMIEVAKDIYADRGTFQVTFPSTKFMETVDWKDIKLKESEYVLKAFPTSSLADDMTGRLQDVQELAQAGMISPRTARKLLRMPDLEMADNLANAAEDLLCSLIEKMIDDEDYQPPEEFYDLTLAKQLILQYYNFAKLQNAPEKVLSLLRQFSAQVDDILGVANAPQAQPQGGPPPANPTAPPTSNLIPNVNGQAA